MNEMFNFFSSFHFYVWPLSLPRWKPSLNIKPSLQKRLREQQTLTLTQQTMLYSAKHAGMGDSQLSTDML